MREGRYLLSSLEVSGQEENKDTHWDITQDWDTVQRCAALMTNLLSWLWPSLKNKDTMSVIFSEMTAEQSILHFFSYIIFFFFIGLQVVLKCYIVIKYCAVIYTFHLVFSVLNFYLLPLALCTHYVFIASLLSCVLCFALEAWAFVPLYTCKWMR